jgi:hypothetical protein
MNLEKIFINFKGNFNYFESIRNDLINFPNDMFCPHGEINPFIEIEVKNEKDSIIISPYEKGKCLDIHLPTEAFDIIIDNTNKTTNFEYNQKRYYIFAEKR